MLQPHSNRRLQLATRIHFGLMREIGVGIDVGRMLKHPVYARDVLLVCDSCSGHDLARLAKAFRGMDGVGAGGTGDGRAAGGSSQFGSSQFGSSLLGSAFGTSGLAPSGPASRSATESGDAAPESVPAD